MRGPDQKIRSKPGGTGTVLIVPNEMACCLSYPIAYGVFPSAAISIFRLEKNHTTLKIETYCVVS